MAAVPGAILRLTNFAGLDPERVRRMVSMVEALGTAGQKFQASQRWDVSVAEKAAARERYIDAVRALLDFALNTGLKDELVSAQADNEEETDDTCCEDCEGDEDCCRSGACENPDSAGNACCG